MPLTQNDYVSRAAGLNVYSVSEMDAEYETRKVIINKANPTNDVYSVAKLYTVTALGLCFDRGLLSPDDLLLSRLPVALPENADPRWKEVTLHMLMKHTAGFGHGLLDIDVDDASLYPTDDYVSIVLSTPLPNAPGAVYQYTDAAYYLLSCVVEAVCGVTAAELLRPVCLGVMRYKEFAWSCCPKGHTIGATGLYVRTEDMVKLGALYLNGGVYRGERVVSQKWVDMVFERGYELSAKSVPGWFGKGGMRGQMLAVNRARGLSVAWQSFEKAVPFERMITE